MSAKLQMQHAQIWLHDISIYGEMLKLAVEYQEMRYVTKLGGITLLFFFYFLSGVRLSPLGTAATIGQLYQPRMIDGDCGAIGGMKIGRGNRGTRRKPAPVPLCLPQIPRDHTRARTRGAAVRSQRLSALSYGAALGLP
jgi:hypothetical protein